MFFTGKMSRKILVLALMVTAVYAGPAVNSCKLQKNTAVEQFRLSTLSGLYGELLTTESNGNIYVVSICRPVPQMFYDPRKLAGAVKLTIEGRAIDLGHIDQTNVVENENSIVLTYVGGDEDRYPSDTCKGLRWKTYLAFICDPFATTDVLTLIDEDPDQPEICQIWFEIKTPKTCNRQPSLPVKELENELIKYKMQINNKKNIERNRTKSNEVDSENKLFHDENDKFRIDKKFSNTKIEENKSQNANYEGKPNVFIYPYPMVKNKSINNENKVDNSNNNVSEDKFPEIKKNNFSTDKNSTNTDIEKRNSNQNNSHDANIENKPINNVNPNVLNKNKSIDIENKNYSYHNTSKSFNNYNNDFMANKTLLNEGNKEYTRKNNLETHSEDKSYYRNKNEVPREKNNFTNKENNSNNSNENTPKSNMSDKKNTYPREGENTLNNKDNYTNPNDSLNMNSNSKTSENINENLDKNGSSNNENDEINSKQKYSENNSSNIAENNFSKSKLPFEDENKGNYSTQNILEDKSSNSENTYFEVNKKPLYNGTIENFQNTNSKDKLIKNKISSSDTENKTTVYETKNSNSNKNFSESILYKKSNYLRGNESNLNYKENDLNQKNSLNISSNGKISVDINNNSGKNDSINGVMKNSIINDKTPDSVIKENNLNQKTNSQKNYSGEKSFQNQNSNQENSTSNSGNKSNNSLPYNSNYDNHENKLPNGEDDSSNKNVTTNNENIVDITSDKNLSNNYNSTSSNNINTANTKSSKTSSFRDNTTNQYVETQNSQTERNENGTVNNSVTNDESGINRTYGNQIINANKKVSPSNQSKPQSNQNPANTVTSENLSNDNNDTSKTLDSTSQSGRGSNLFGFFSKLFPNGIQLSATTVLGVLCSLSAVSVLIGTAVNRFYYKRTGTDQIPLKGTFQNILIYVKVIIKKIFCCCGGDLEAPDVTNEKSPLLRPRNISTPTTKDEKSNKKEKYKKSSNQGEYQRSDSADNDGKEGQNNKDEYGSMSNTSNSPSSDKKYGNKNQKLKNASGTDVVNDESLPYGDKEKLVKTESHLQGNPMKKMFDTVIDTKIIPTFGRFFKKAGGNVEKTVAEEKKKNIEIISNDSSFKPQPLNEEAKYIIDFDETTAQDKLKTSSLDTKSTKLDESQKISVTPVSLITKTLNKNQPIVAEEIINEKKGEIIESIDRSQTNSNNMDSRTDAVKNNKKDEMFNSSQDVVVVTPSDITKKTNKVKSISNVDNEEKNQKIKNVLVSDESNISEKNDNEDESTETIEEILYVDHLDGSEDEEEIIEEIIETTYDDSPEAPDVVSIEDSKSLPPLDSRKVRSKTTVRKTSIRKKSSSSLPGEVKTVVETVINDEDIPENEKKSLGFQLGIGKSGVNMNFGEKKFEIGKSGLKFGKNADKSANANENKAMTIKLDKSGLKLNRNKNKTSKKSEGKNNDSDEQNALSPEKGKKSKSLPNLKIFKRSVSQPSNPNIQEVEDESSTDIVSKKTSKGKSRLLKFGKSRSKSSEILETSNVTTEMKSTDGDVTTPEKDDVSSSTSASEIVMPFTDYVFKKIGDKN